MQEVLAQAGDMLAAGQPLLRFRNTELELDVLDREGRLVESITQLQTYEKQLRGRPGRQREGRRPDRVRHHPAAAYRRAARRPDGPRLSSPATCTSRSTTSSSTTGSFCRCRSPRTGEQEALRRRQIPQIRSELATLQESLKVTRAKLDSLVVRAPVAGRLTDMDIKLGEIRNRGQRLGQIVPDTGFKLQAQIDEYYLDRVRPGQTGDVTLEGRAVPVRVTRVDPQVKNATFQVDLAFEGAMPRGLLPGQALEGRLTLGGDRPALVLPAGAFLERTGGDWVMVADADGTPRRPAARPHRPPQRRAGRGAGRPQARRARDHLGLHRLRKSRSHRFGQIGEGADAQARERQQGLPDHRGRDPGAERDYPWRRGPASSSPSWGRPAAASPPC